MIARLIGKELRECWGYIAAALLASVPLALLTDPRFLWIDLPPDLAFESMIDFLVSPSESWAGHGAGARLIVPILILFLMGLGAYSREHGNATYAFLISRPVRWWWVYLAKGLVGVIAAVGVAVVSVGVYALACPQTYRSWLDAQVLGYGIARPTGYFAGAFLLGLAASAASRGFGHALAMGLPLCLFLAMVSGAFVNPLHRLYLTAWLLIALFTTTLPAVRPPFAFRRLRRLWPSTLLWGAGLVVMCFAMYTFARLIEKREYLSPDFRVAAYQYSPTPEFEEASPTRPENLWIRVARDRPILVDRLPAVDGAAWSPDGRTFLYYGTSRGRPRLKAVSADTGWRPVSICTLPDDVDLGRYGASPYEWSPSGDRLAIARGGEELSGVLVVSLRSRQCTTVYRGDMCYYFWWIGDDRIAVMDGECNVRVVDAGG